MKKKSKKRGKASGLGELYRDSWNYLKESKRFIFIIIGIFIFFCFLGFFIMPPDSVLQEIMSLLQELLEQIEGLSYPEITAFIFFNNLKGSFLGVVLGVGFGIFPLISAVFNGYLLGFVANLSVGSNGFASLWRLLPHGIFELPAVFVSLGMGLRLGFVLFGKRRKGDLKRNLISALKVFFFVVVPLLIIAAIIEGALISFVGS